MMNWSDVYPALWIVAGAAVVLLFVVYVIVPLRARLKVEPLRMPREPEPDPTPRKTPGEIVAEAIRKDAVPHLETFQTPRGPVVVGWKDEKEALENVGRGVVMFGDMIQRAVNRKVIPDELIAEARDTGSGSRFEQVKRQIGDILKANPEADLKKYEVALEVEIAVQDGPAARVDRATPQFFDEEQQLAKITAIAQVERFYETHKGEFCGPGKSPQLCAEFQAMINGHKKRILERM